MHTCIRATTLDKLLDSRIKTIMDKDWKGSVNFWEGYLAALEWLRTSIQSLGELHEEVKDASPENIRPGS